MLELEFPYTLAASTFWNNPVVDIIMQTTTAILRIFLNVFIVIPPIVCYLLT